MRGSRINEGSGAPEEALGLLILERLRAENAHVSSVLAHAFRAHRVRSAFKATIANRVYGVVRSQRLLDHVIDRLATSPMHGRKRDRARWLLRTYLDGEIQLPLVRRQLSGLDWARVPDIVRAVQALPDAEERLAVAESLPDWLARRWIASLGAPEATVLARALNQPAPQTIRVNTLRIARDELAARLRDQGLTVASTPRAAQGITIASRTDLFRLPEFRLGLFEVQDEGSQLVSELVAPPPGGSVLDACAGTGGKTLHLGAMLAGRGTLVAAGVGPPGSRQLLELRRRARRAGLHNVRFNLLDESPTGRERKQLAGRFDRVLVDAPCSGLGVLRRNPEARWRLQPSDIAHFVVLQREILERFAPCVRPGGRLVYATCSLLPEENEDVAAAFQDAHPEFTAVDAKEILGSRRANDIGDGHVLRLWPHRHDTDGFFAVVWRRAAERTGAAATAAGGSKRNPGT